MGGRQWWSHRRYKDALLAIENHVAEGRNSAACRDIEALLSWDKDANGSLRYLLGSCELARGHIEATEDAWASVAPGSEFSERAILGRMWLLRNQGKLAEAEKLILAAATDPRNDRTSLLVGLVPILMDLGRREESTTFIEDRWKHLDSRAEGALEPAIKLVLWHVDLTTMEPVATEATKSYLEEAARLAPNDDRVWLGRANLAMQSGDMKEAERLLKDCEKQRLDDPAVWRAKVKWAMATEAIDEVERASKRMPKEEELFARRHRIDAWLARQRGETEKERSALEEVIAAEPGDLAALDRLIEIHKSAGRSDLAIKLTETRITMRELLDRYHKLRDRKQPIRDAEELARIAERLGRDFEAKGFLTIAEFQEPGRDLAD